MIDPISICTIITSSLIVLYLVYQVAGPAGDKMREAYYDFSKNLGLDTCMVPIGRFLVNIRPRIARFRAFHSVAIDGDLFDIPKGIWKLRSAAGTCVCLVKTKAPHGTFAGVTLYYDRARRAEAEAFLDPPPTPTQA